MNSLLLVFNIMLITLAGFGWSTVQNGYLRLLLSSFIGILLTSLLFYWSLAGGIHLPYVLGFSSMLLLSLTWIYKKYLRVHSPRIAWNRYNLVFLLALLLAAYRFLALSQNWGEWDAFSIWNLHAKFLFYPDVWDRVFYENFKYSNNDYPLMLPSLVAMGWIMVGKIVPSVPAFLSFCVYCALIGVGFSTIKNRLFAIFFVLILLMDSHFLAIAVSQNADTLIAFIYLVSMILFRQSLMSSNKGELVFLAGFFASSAVWCKNEGWVFFLVLSIFFLLANSRKKNLLIAYVAGSAIFIASALLFKILYAPDNYLFREQATQRFDRLFSFETYVIIFRYLKNNLWEHYPSLLFLSLTILLAQKRFTINKEWAVIVLTFAGYLAVYLITPFDLKWHLSTSLDRLIHQLYPAAVCLCVLQLEQLPVFSGINSHLQKINRV